MCSFASHGGLASSRTCLLSVWLSVLHGGLTASCGHLLALCACCLKLQGSGRSRIVLSLVVTSLFAPSTPSFAMVTSPVQFVMVIVVLFVLGGPMVVFSIILREVIQDDGPPPWSLLLPAPSLAYYVALSWVRFIETTAGFGFHTIHCRLLTAACLFSTMVVHLPVATAILLALFVHIVCPPSLLRFPLSKRPAAMLEPNSKRSRQQKGDYGPRCNDLAKFLAAAANANISGYFVDGWFQVRCVASLPWRVSGQPSTPAFQFCLESIHWA